MGTITILTDKENDIIKRQKHIEDITKHASDFQAFCFSLSDLSLMVNTWACLVLFLIKLTLLRSV
jgi:hypothetical protein